MKQLAYMSLGVDITHDMILDILKKSRENNIKKDVTGILLYHSGFFLQLLEGDPKILEELILLIKRDKRHRQFITIYNEKAPSEKRLCRDWSMAYANLEDKAFAGLDLDLANRFLFWQANAKNQQFLLKREEVTTLFSTLIGRMKTASS